MAYLKGAGVGRDEGYAVDLLRIAAKRRHPDAVLMLGTCHMEVRGGSFGYMPTSRLCGCDRNADWRHACCKRERWRHFSKSFKSGCVACKLDPNQHSRQAEIGMSSSERAQLVTSHTLTLTCREEAFLETSQPRSHCCGKPLKW
jgi:hypothetical protein